MPEWDEQEPTPPSTFSVELTVNMSDFRTDQGREAADAIFSAVSPTNDLSQAMLMCPPDVVDYRAFLYVPQDLQTVIGKVAESLGGRAPTEPAGCLTQAVRGKATFRGKKPESLFLVSVNPAPYPRSGAGIDVEFRADLTDYSPGERAAAHDAFRGIVLRTIDVYQAAFGTVPPRDVGQILPAILEANPPADRGLC